MFFIPYQNGGGTIVDSDFTNPIHCFSWYNNRGYAQTTITLEHRKQKQIKMHRLLLGFPKEVDHINGKRNDNRIKNLRSVTSSQNACNRNIHRKGKLIGTTLDKRRNKWISQTRINNKLKFIGYYDTEIEAHIAYTMYRRGLYINV